MEHTHLVNVPPLDHAVLIVALSGWNDAASAATWSVKYLINQWDAQPIGDIDGEVFYDFTESRPQVRITRGAVRRVTWPTNRYFSIPSERPETARPKRDVVLLHGEEPQLRWRTFAQEIIEVCRQAHISEVALLGSLVAEVPHTAPVQVTGTSSRETMLRRMESHDVTRADYSGVTGVITVVHDAAREAGMTASSLWAVAPHYVSATPNLAVSEALLRKLDALYGFGLELHDLTRAARRFTARVSSLVEEDPDVSAYVHELERRTHLPLGEADLELEGPDDLTDEYLLPGELPTPEQAIRSAEDLLRQFREGHQAE